MTGWTEQIPAMEKTIKSLLKKPWRMVDPRFDNDPWSRVITNGVLKFAVHAGEYALLGEEKFIEVFNGRMEPKKIAAPVKKEPVANA